MTQLIKCDGANCNKSSIDADAKNHDILPVKFMTVVESRFGGFDTIIEADLCADCRSMIGHNYFGRPAQGSTEIPAFLEPDPGVIELTNHR